VEQVPVVHITMKEVYELVLQHIGKVDTLIAHNETTRIRVDDHEARLRTVEAKSSAAADAAVDHTPRIASLERLRWPVPSIVALISLAALIVAIFS
jgi:hypothetical protein